jgi:hypothetical protein
MWKKAHFLRSISRLKVMGIENFRTRQNGPPLLVLLLLMTCLTTPAQENSNDYFWLGNVLRLERDCESARRDVRFYEDQIQRAEKTIATSEDIVRRAREQGKPEAERVALNTIARAKETRANAAAKRDAAQKKLDDLTFALNFARTEFLRIEPKAGSFASVMTNSTGLVSVQPLDGPPVVIDKNRPLVLKKGDLLVTAASSELELQTLGGRGNLKLAENTRIEIGEDPEAKTEFIKLVKGRIDVGVQPIEVYEKDLETLIKRYEEDLKTVKDGFKERIVKEYKRQKVKILKYRNKFEIRTPSGSCCAIRATRFSVKVDDDGNEEVIVTEGVVELAPPAAENKIILKAGEKAVISKDGTISKPEKIGGSR